MRGSVSASAATRWSMWCTRDVAPEPLTTMTFHCRGAEAEALVASGDPFYAGWGGGLVAMVLRDNTDWTEVKELLTDSYCYLAPKKLIALLPPL